EDVGRLSALITAATERGQVRPVCDPERAAVRIFSLIDALGVQAAIRGGGFDDYTDVQAFLIGVVGQVLGAALTRPWPVPRGSSRGRGRAAPGHRNGPRRRSGGRPGPRPGHARTSA